MIILLGQLMVQIQVIVKIMLILLFHLQQMHCILFASLFLGPPVHMGNGTRSLQYMLLNYYYGWTIAVATSIIQFGRLIKLSCRFIITYGTQSLYFPAVCSC